MSLCPSHCCTVRKSTPAHKHRVANVERNLCSQKSSSFSSARSAQVLRQSRKSSFGLLTKKPKTLAVYTTALNYFTESCRKFHMHEIERYDPLKFTGFLRDEKELSPRSTDSAV